MMESPEQSSPTASAERGGDVRADDGDEGETKDGGRPGSQKALDNDVAQLVGLGLSLEAIEQMWLKQGRPELAGCAREAGERLMAGCDSTHVVPIARQASLGLELVSASPKGGSSPGASAESVMRTIAALRAEWDDPPERFRDPIMLTLMDEPMVLSTGHTFDRSTIYDAGGRLRFERCPLTRTVISDTAYPLVYLKREIIDFKLRRLDAVLDAAGHCARDPMLQLLNFAKELLDSVGSERYQERAAKYWALRLQTCGESAERLLDALNELADDLSASVSAGEGQSELIVAKLMDEQSKALVALVGQQLESGQPMRAARMVHTCVKRLHALAARPNWVGGWVSLMAAIVSGGGLTDGDTAAMKTELLASLDVLRPPREHGGDGDGAGDDNADRDDHVTCDYWSLRLALHTGSGSADTAANEQLLRELLHMSRSCLRGDQVRSVHVAGAGCEECNGDYHRDGVWGGAPLFKNGQWWLLRYQLRRSTYWYIADKDKLNVDDGDLYRVMSNAPLPPSNNSPMGTWRLAKDGRMPIPTIRLVRSQPATATSRVRRLYERYREQLERAGVDISRLETPKRGALRTIEWRAGWEIDQISLVPRGDHIDALRPEAAIEDGVEGLGAHAELRYQHCEWDEASQLWRHGVRPGTHRFELGYDAETAPPIASGGGERTPFELDEGEALVAVRAWMPSRSRYLGFAVEFETSSGRQIALRGVKHDEYIRATHQRAEYRCESEYEVATSEIVQLLFVDSILVKVMVRDISGALAWQPCRQFWVEDGEEAQELDLLEPGNNESIGTGLDSDDMSSGEETEEEEGEETEGEDGEDGDEMGEQTDVAEWAMAPEWSHFAEEEDMQLQMALALSLAETSPSATVEVAAGQAATPAEHDSNEGGAREPETELQ